jgi:hypothetical protein
MESRSAGDEVVRGTRGLARALGALVVRLERAHVVGRGDVTHDT